MRSTIAERALMVTLSALVLLPVACRDESPSPTPMVGSGGSSGKGGTGRGGTGGRASGGTAGTSQGGAGGGAGGSSSSDAGDASLAEGGSDATTTDAIATDAAPQADVLVTDATGDGAVTAMRSFFAHPTYPTGVIRPSRPQAMLDVSVSGFHRAWKTRFLANGCGGSYVKANADFGAGLATVSELHGYGMMIAAIMAGADDNAKSTFDAMFRFARMWKSTGNAALMAHEVQITGTACRVMPGMTSQTDGDLDIAFSLLLADKQWGSGGTINYLQEARNMIAAIKTSDMNANTKLPVLGDWVTATEAKYNGGRSSDYIVDHLRAFSSAVPAPDPFWTQAVDAVYATFAKIQTTNSPTTGLLPDFLINLATTPAPAPANWSFANSPNDGQFHYHAARVPLRLAIDLIASNGAETRAKAALTKINDWIKAKAGNNPAAIVDGYRIDTGANIGNGASWVFEGPLGAAAIVDAANQAWLDAIWTRISAGDPGSDVNAETLRLLSMIVMSGHWWAP